ncbi:hypothetical protein AB5N19_11055 [Seiridium cardinale]|uniref:Uncharacterized protein n=1 Tax=Seiridium cardinale TaxID=138064 RepID=A0ABR2XIF2_9PEZI
MVRGDEACHNLLWGGTPLPRPLAIPKRVARTAEGPQEASAEKGLNPDSYAGSSDDYRALSPEPAIDSGYGRGGGKGSGHGGGDGVKPYSKQNVLGFPIVMLGGVGAAITTTYAGSNAMGFSLDKFWFGCVLGTAENVVSAPINCRFSVVGYDSIGKRVGFA